MDSTKSRLLTAAKKAAENAYSPYSGYKVGAAVLGADGKVYTGCNVENASYGATNCAERTAIFNMVSQGCTQITEMAVYCGAGSSCMPCGVCRQVISEFTATPNILIHTLGSELQKSFTVNELLPHAFSGEFNEKI